MRTFLLSYFIPGLLTAAPLNYQVDFLGVQEEDILDEMRMSSQLVLLKKKKIASLGALHQRAEADKPQLLHILQSHGYLEAELKSHISETIDGYQVSINIEPGPRYLLADYRLLRSHESLDLKKLGLALKQPYHCQKLLQAEGMLLRSLAEKGHPHALIHQREIIADGATKTMSILLDIDPGPEVKFGPVTIHGNTQVSQRFTTSKIAWQEGGLYDERLIHLTEKKLMDSALFSSVTISSEAMPNAQGEIPITIHEVENKHKSVSLGASFQTTFGAGLTFGWENRNVGGLGRKLSLQGDITQKSHSGRAVFEMPDFPNVGQQLLFKAETLAQNIRAFDMQSYMAGVSFQHHINADLFYLIGARANVMRVSQSTANGHFPLGEIPFSLHYFKADDRLNPKQGFNLTYHAEGGMHLNHPTRFFLSQIAHFSTYLPVGKKEPLIIAQKWSLGSIFAFDSEDVPVPKRIFGGSEDTLRGYRFFTVSPLENGQPKGGLSALFYTLETRLRLSSSFGLVPFFDLGNVFAKMYPTLDGKWYKSTGIGLRYYSFMGPLKLDLAFPMDRRKAIDPAFWIFVNLGQTF